MHKHKEKHHEEHEMHEKKHHKKDHHKSKKGGMNALKAKMAKG